MDDMLDKILRWEDGEMSMREEVEFFSELMTTGTINHLQGMYGRRARDLIESGYLDRDGSNEVF